MTLSDWQPIETAPPEKELLLFFPAIGPRKGQTVYARAEMMRVGLVRDFPSRLPTHWMPLPEPPVQP